ncbi:MAG TPA: ferrous iron transport protein B [Deltaproteobacteria bacterium]|nr:ferrous iron transport protein B [Deltaproteobacteria bacterium]
MAFPTITIALAGNPNSGKTTIFNNLTGARQKVGNWPGVTVEKKEGMVTFKGHQIKVVDLPGTYSLTAYSVEERVARDFILNNHPDVVVDILDASNLERNLYLATQLIEMGVNLILVLNMADVARSRGIDIDGQLLSQLLGVPVVFTVGKLNEGTQDLLEKVIEVAHQKKDKEKTIYVTYGKEIEEELGKISEEIVKAKPKLGSHYTRWLSVKLLENDPLAVREVKSWGKSGREVLDVTQKSREHLEEIYHEDPEILITEQRYGFIQGACREVIKTSTQKKIDISQKIDLVLTNRLFGFPIFIFFIWAMFQLTFTLGEYPMNWIDSLMSMIQTVVSNLLPAGLLKDLIVNGILAGVGSVIIFLPNILILFFCIALLEDTGYMARAAFLMDRIMHWIGLHGKSFIPMLIGFGCNVPAIMATRTLESERDRILTILINPLMSCSARLPVYVLIAGTFFAGKAGSVIFSIYLLGIVLAILTAQLFSKTILKGMSMPFVMELPPYRVPTLKSLMIHMWDRGVVFLKKMGGVILIGSVIIWALGTFPKNPDINKKYSQARKEIEAQYTEKIAEAKTPEEQAKIKAELEQALQVLNIKINQERMSKTYLGRIGKVVEPVLKPLGFDWRIGIALLSGFVAKEVVVSTMGVIYSGGEGEKAAEKSLQKALKAEQFNPAKAYAFMAFVLIYTPCLATVAAIRREIGTKWMIFNVVYSLTLAWVISWAIYHGGKLLA